MEVLYFFILIGVVLFGILTQTKLDRIERKLDDLMRDRRFVAQTQPDEQKAPANQISRKPDTPETPHTPTPAESPCKTEPSAPGGPASDAGKSPRPLQIPEMRTVAGTSPATPQPVPQKTAESPKPQRKTDYEKYIGENLFGKIGIFVLVIGLGFFVKYAIDNDWLGETMRTILGFACGAALMGIAARLKDKYPSFSSLLAGGAFAVFYVTTAIAYHYYHIFSQGGAFALLLALTIAMSAIAIRYDRRELAVVSLAGGLIAPFLTSSGDGNYIFLFSYLLILHGGMFTLALFKKWWELPVVSFAATYLILTVFTFNRCFPDIADETLAQHMLLFSTLFYLLFATSVIAVFRAQNRRFYLLLTGVAMLNNFIYLGFGLFFLSGIPLSAKMDGVLPLFIAAVNALLFWSTRRKEESTGLLRQLLLGLTILFVTIAIPIQLDANAITVCWAAEAVLLLILYIRTHIRTYECGAALLLLLTLAGTVFTLGRTGSETITMFLNRDFLSGLFAAGALGCTAWLLYRRQDVFREARILKYPLADTVLICCTHVVVFALIIRETSIYFSGSLLTQINLLVTVALLTGSELLLRNRFPITRLPALYWAEAGVAAVLFAALSGMGFRQPAAGVLSWLSAAVVVFLLTDVARRFYRSAPQEKSHTQFTVYLNLLATICWITMVSRLLKYTDMREASSAGFSIALISAGALQMVLGMRRHQRVLRIFSLGVFAVVLLKLALYDLWQMPTIGRIVVSILLGAILLVLSFLYQRLKSALFKGDD